MHQFCLSVKELLKKRLNNNIYTRILFFNVSVFLISVIALMFFFDFVVEQITYEYVEQELLSKAKGVNIALNQLQASTAASEQTKRYFKLVQKDWENAKSFFEKGLISKAEYDKAKEANRIVAALHNNAQTQSEQEMLELLAHLFAARITVFDQNGNILSTSAQQERVPGSKVEARFSEVLGKGEITITREVDNETGQPSFFTVVPVGNEQNEIETGILLKTTLPNIDVSLNKMRLYLVISGMSILVIIILLSVYLAMHISMPISRLATSVAEVSRDGDAINIEDQSLDEINILANQLNKLVFRLHKMQDESSKMEEERDRLFTEISHELRTPLTSIQGFVEAIRDGMVEDEVLQKKYLDIIYTQTMHINRLVDDILVLNRLESGNITVRKQPLDLVSLAHSVITSMETEANTRNNSLFLDKQTEKAIVIGDVDRMEQILRNLLKNAIKATKNGVIRVSISICRGEEVILSIQDNGIGIAAEDLPHIWDRFFRVKNQREDDGQGSGLGLAIVKKLVQLQDGAINVISQLGKGTTFSISFPRTKRQWPV